MTSPAGHLSDDQCRQALLDALDQLLPALFETLADRADLLVAVWDACLLWNIELPAQVPRIGYTKVARAFHMAGNQQNPWDGYASRLAWLVYPPPSERSRLELVQ